MNIEYANAYNILSTLPSTYYVFIKCKLLLLLFVDGNKDENSFSPCMILV